MEELNFKYIAKHGLHGMFDGIEKMNEHYEWAISQFKNCPKMLKSKGKFANALQALFASYKVTKRSEEIKSENKSLSSQVSNNVMSLRN